MVYILDRSEPSFSASSIFSELRGDLIHRLGIGGPLPNRVQRTTGEQELMPLTPISSECPFIETLARAK
jgi:hypothetical protein